MKFFHRQVAEKIRKYHFELRHIAVFFIILVSSQVLISFLQRRSLQSFLVRTQKWYQRDSAERFANLAATSLELLLETVSPAQAQDEAERRKIVQAFNIILSQQLLLEHVEDACVLVQSRDGIFAIDNGEVLYRYFFENAATLPPPDYPHAEAIRLYREHQPRIIATEKILSVLQGQQTFHVFVPFVPKGEFAGVIYIKNAPDFGFVTREIFSSFNESSMLFMSMIFLGFTVMFFISSYTMQERDAAQEELYRQREEQLKERIHFQKEAQFAKRIYHTHHKAEKVMGFIKEDLRAISSDNIEEIKYRVTKYANFMSRVIYDMKWFEPPIQTIRNPLFRTDLNEVIRFLVENICLRVAKGTSKYHFRLDLDDRLPPVNVNEFVVWEILEPLLQNAMDHSRGKEITVRVITRYDPERKCSTLIIEDDGPGIPPELLEVGEDGVKRIFHENISTKENEQNSGYGCYLAYEISRQRCGWELDAENLPQAGCRFVFTIPNGETQA